MAENTAELTSATTSTTLANDRAQDLFTPVLKSEQELRGAHLGQLPLAPGGFSQGFRDSDTVAVSGTGIKFTVTQASHGPTSITASAEAGYEIGALGINPNTQAPEWIKPHLNSRGAVDIATDRGNMSKISVDSPFWNQENMGNSGVRSGAVKITDTRTGKVKYYALGAQFTGSPDNWQVRRGVIELTPTPALLKATELQLPSQPSTKA